MLCFPLESVIEDLCAAGFAQKELERMKEAAITDLYDSLIMDSWFWQRRLQNRDPEHPEYPDPEISLAQTLAGMTAGDRDALRARISKA